LLIHLRDSKPKPNTTEIVNGLGIFKQKACLRVISDDYLKPCLMVTDNLVDVLTPLREGASDDELRELSRWLY